MNIKQKASLILAGFLLCFTFVAYGEVALAATSCDTVDTSVVDCGTPSGRGGVWDLLVWVINIMTAGIGILAVGGLVYASIRYSVAGGNPEQSKQAKIMITNVIVGMIMYALMYALLNFLVPGGLFS